MTVCSPLAHGPALDQYLFGGYMHLRPTNWPLKTSKTRKWLLHACFVGYDVFACRWARFGLLTVDDNPHLSPIS